MAKGRTNKRGGSCAKPPRRVHFSLFPVSKSRLSNASDIDPSPQPRPRHPTISPHPPSYNQTPLHNPHPPTDSHDNFTEVPRHQPFPGHRRNFQWRNPSFLPLSRSRELTQLSVVRIEDGSWCARAPRRCSSVSSSYTSERCKEGYPRNYFPHVRLIFRGTDNIMHQRSIQSGEWEREIRQRDTFVWYIDARWYIYAPTHTHTHTPLSRRG